MTIEHILFFLSLGLFVGTLGTLIGAGGGFILMPILIFLYPDYKPEVISSLSLSVVFLNALSGTLAYVKMKRVDYKSGLIFAAATIPGALLGAFSTNFIPRKVFDMVFGALLMIVSIYLFVRSKNKTEVKREVKNGVSRNITDAEGNEHSYKFNITTGIIISVFVGFLSSLLGIGGGIVHVPVMINLLNFPIHIATATSHFTLAIMALAGVIEHIAEGHLQGQYLNVLLLGGGAILGAQLGAQLSKKIHGKWIVRGLSIALFFVGVRILFTIIK